MNALIDAIQQLRTALRQASTDEVEQAQHWASDLACNSGYAHSHEPMSNIFETLCAEMRQRFYDRRCCSFHGAGGAEDLGCGGDQPSSEGKHLRSCAVQAGGDCTCGASDGGEDYDDGQPSERQENEDFAQDNLPEPMETDDCPF